MKLKKLISLVLVFVMMVSVFSAVSVSAAGDTAKLTFIPYDTNGKVVTGNLEVGKTYLIGVKLTEMTEKNFTGAALALHYDSSVLQFVDENGVASTDPSKAIVMNDDADSKYAYYMPLGYAISPENNLVKYTLAVSTAAMLNGVSKFNYPSGEIEIIKLRVKALKNGKTDLSLATSELGTGKFDPAFENGYEVTTPNTELVTVTAVAPTFRVGDISYVSGTPAALNSVKCGFGTTAEDVIANKLLKKMIVTYTDDEGGNVDLESEVKWTAPANFDGSKAGKYTFTGAITAPENYKGSALTATVEVEIAKLLVKNDVAISVNAKKDAAPALPAKVTVELDNGTKAELSVTWGEIADKTGVMTVEGTLAGTDNIDVNGKKAVATVTFAEALTTGSFKTITNEKNVKVDVDAENIDTAIAAILGSTVYGTDASDKAVFKDVTWEKTSVTPEGGYKVGDTVTYKPVAEGVDFGDFVVTVTVSVPDGKASVAFDKTTFEASFKDDAGTTADKAVENAAFTATYTDKTTASVKASDIAWNATDVAAFDGSKAGTYTINGTWTDKYGHTVNVIATIKITVAGATKIEIKSSTTAVNSISSLTMGTLSSKTVYAVLTPAETNDSVTWKSSNTAYATVTANGDGKSATIKTKNSSGRVTITATADSGVSDSFTLIVNANNGGAGSYNGPYKNNGGANSLLPSTADDIAAEDVIKSSPFSDLEGYNWAATQIETIRLLGIVSGKTADCFAPADDVTRAEFLAMLVRLYNLKAGANVKEFTDVSADEWFYETVKIASSLGIAYGYENGAFDPNAVITREDMAVFAKRALEAAGIEPSEGLTSVFSDAGDISAYAYDAVDYMTGVGVINGMGDGTFMPRATANRAQAAVVIYNLYIKK